MQHLLDSLTQQRTKLRELSNPSLASRLSLPDFPLMQRRKRNSTYLSRNSKRENSLWREQSAKSGKFSTTISTTRKKNKPLIQCLNLSSPFSFRTKNHLIELLNEETRDEVNWDQLIEMNVELDHILLTQTNTYESADPHQMPSLLQRISSPVPPTRNTESTRSINHGTSEISSHSLSYLPASPRPEKSLSTSPLISRLSNDGSMHLLPFPLLRVRFNHPGKISQPRCRTLRNVHNLKCC